MLMDTVSLAVAGFSTIAAGLLLFTYTWLLDLPNKSVYSVLSCAVLLSALAGLQVCHLAYFTGGAEPLTVPYYRIALFLAPPAFYCFGRWAILPSEPLRPIMLLQLLPVALLLVDRLEISLPLLFLCGAGYSLWLGVIVYGLRAQRQQFRFEFFFLGVMSAMALLVLILGFSIP
jgi:hypothetical protein